MLAPTMRRFLALALALAGCAAPPASPPLPAPAPDANSAALHPAGKPGAIHFIEDDLPGAAAKARAEGKALFVDAWAPWCHTCLSMKNFVFTDPALRPLADRVIFASVDTDRPEAAAFLDRHPVKAWPTFFVLDPATDKVAGYWAGSGSLAEMRGFIEESLAGMRGAATDPAARAFAEARSAHGEGKLEEAAAAYERAIAAAPAIWPNRSAALLGWMEALAGAKRWEPCVQLGTARIQELHGSSAPSDFSAYLLTCADKLPAGDAQKTARTTAAARLRDVTAHPPPDASVDDRQDALDILSGALADLGDAAGARKAQEDRLALLEQAARSAPSPEIAHTFDYARANTYLALGRGDDAVRMLAQREQELPDSYEPPARLAGVLLKMGKLPEAKAAIERALARSYGPRRLRYLEARAQILDKLGDKAAALATLRDEVKGWESLPPGQASPEQLARARRRLAEAEKSAPR